MFQLSEKELSIIEATIEVCGRYGISKTSMADIARESGMSRPALYNFFPNKGAIVQAATRYLYERAFSQATAALQGKGPLERLLTEAFQAWSADFVRLRYGFPHGLELVDSSGKFAAEISASYVARFLQEVADCIERAEQAKEITLLPLELSKLEAAELLLLALHGLPRGIQEAEDYRVKERALVRLFVRALHIPPKA